MSVKLAVGMEMLGECKSVGEYDAATGLLVKILGNVIKAPEEAKFRSLRVTNPKISQMLATRGVRAVLIGVGFVEQGDQLVLGAEAPIEPLGDALSRLEAQAVERAASESEAKAAEMLRRKEGAEKENEERKRMKMQIADDAALRKEPGWTAKAAGVKGGKAITSCSDIGIGKDAGG